MLLELSRLRPRRRDEAEPGPGDGRRSAGVRRRGRRKRFAIDQGDYEIWGCGVALQPLFFRDNWKIGFHDQLTAMSETRSLRSLRAMPLPFGSSVGVPSTRNTYW